MEKTWVKDVKEGERVKAIFAVARKAVPTAKSGKSYLAATLVDRTGEIEARSFDRVEEFSALFEEKDLVEVEGGERKPLHYDTCEACGGIWVEGPEEGDIPETLDRKGAAAQIVEFFRNFARK